MSKYCKTAKGHQEISERAAGLGLRARRLLILIDGQRDSEELARLAGDAQVEDSLRTLAEAGFIEADAASAATAMAPAAHASGSSMPWEAPLQSILESIEGPVAKIIAVMIIIITGLTLAFGDTSGGARKLIQIVFGLSIAFAASSFFLSFFSFGGGALV